MPSACSTSGTPIAATARPRSSRRGARRRCQAGASRPTTAPAAISPAPPAGRTSHVRSASGRPLDGETVDRRPREGSASSSRTPSSTTSSSCAPTARRSTTSASSSTTSTCASPTSSAATITSPTRRGRSCSTRRSARRCPRFAHVPLILGAGQGPALEAPRRHVGASRIATRATCPTRWSTTSPVSAGRTAIRRSSRRAELIEHFSLENVGKSAAVFNLEKLAVGELPVPEGDTRRQSWPTASARSSAAGGLARARGRGVARARSRARCASARRRWSSWPSSLRFYVIDDDRRSTPRRREASAAARSRRRSTTWRSVSSALAAWDATTDRSGLSRRRIAAHGITLGKLAQPVRVAVTGGTASPGIFEVLDVLGRERTLARLRAALARLASASEPAVALTP